MMRRIFIFAVGIVAAGLLAGCASSAPRSEVADQPEAVDVWALLARGEGERAMQYFMGEVDVNASDSRGRTPLHLAAENRDPILASFFISLGAEVDALDNGWLTPLSISAENQDPATARVLAAAGADIHHLIGIGGSPARTAVERGNGEFLAALLNADTLAAVDSADRTILHIAAESGNANAADTILNAGGILAQRDGQGRTALDIALARHDSRNHAETAERLILAGAVSDHHLHRYIAPAARTSNYNIRSTDGMTPLHYIARRGYTGYLGFVLERGANINIQNASGSTPLHEAARSGNIQAMQLLLDHGADINAQDASGNSVLHIAFPPEVHLSALNLLLSRGANLNLRDYHGASPLHVAIILNRSNGVVANLLSAGADVNTRDVEGKTPLYIAVEKNRFNLIPMLLAYGSDIFAEDNNGISPFVRSLLEENDAMAYALINYDTVRRRDSAGNTMLHISVRASASLDVLNTILDYSSPASVNARNYAGDTSLAMAVRMDEMEVGELLLHRGADIFAVNSDGESPLSLTFPPVGGDRYELRCWMLTPQTLSARNGLGNTSLHYAAHWRLDHWIPHLIQIGANTEAQNATGETPLFIAARHNSPSTIQVFVANGAALSARDSLGNSALHAAVRWHALDSAETLLDLGLDINSQALNGKTPLHDSIRLGMPEAQSLLLDRGANIEMRDAEGNTPFMEAVFAGNPETMEMLAEMGADPNTRNLRGDTPLHVAVAMERPDMATPLLGWGGSIHARNALGRTPYQGALASPRMVRTLLTRDRLHSPDNNGSSPLHIAIQERVPINIVRAIVELGPRLSSVDADGRTPVRLALEMNMLDSARLLSDAGSDVFIVGRDGMSAAEISLTRGEDAVRALFSGRAINARDLSGNTILHHAARHGNTAIITQLLSLGAFKEVRNTAAERPVDIARRWNNPGAAALLN